MQRAEHQATQQLKSSIIDNFPTGRYLSFSLSFFSSVYLYICISVYIYVCRPGAASHTRVYVVCFPLYVYVQKFARLLARMSCISTPTVNHICQCQPFWRKKNKIFDTIRSCRSVSFSLTLASSAHSYAHTWKVDSICS